MTSTIKVNNIQNQCGQNIINENSNTITIGASGDTIALASGASQSGFGRTGTVDWQTGSIKTTDFTAVNGQGFFVNTTSGTVAVTLPGSPSAGNIVGIADYAGTAANNNITINRNGSPFQGTTVNGVINTERQTTTLVYVDAVQGWVPVNSNDQGFLAPEYVAATGGTITCCGDFKIHTFTGPGTFCVSNAGNTVGNNQVEYLVVAGGGSGGRGYYGGGGGAGGFRFASPTLAPATYPAKPLAGPASITATVAAFPIAVGAGGAASPNKTNPAADGSGAASTFSTITSAGGGGGGNRSGPNCTAGASGGSGGGHASSCAPSTSAAGNTPSVSPPQGQPGGNNPGTPSDRYGNGGGGATQAGENAPEPAYGGGYGGDGGGLPAAFGANGVICGSVRYYSGGGGGGSRPCKSGGAGGKGGGGEGGQGNDAGTAGTTNSGGGGGGGGMNDYSGGAGGSGIVVIRYKFQN